MKQVLLLCLIANLLKWKLITDLLQPGFFEVLHPGGEKASLSFCAPKWTNRSSSQIHWGKSAHWPTLTSYVDVTCCTLSFCTVSSFFFNLCLISSRSFVSCVPEPFCFWGCWWKRSWRQAAASSGRCLGSGTKPALCGRLLQPQGSCCTSQGCSSKKKNAHSWLLCFPWWICLLRGHRKLLSLFTVNHCVSIVFFLIFTCGYVPADHVQVKVVDPKTKQCSTLAGTGEAGDTLGPEFNMSSFSEPGGICVGDGGKLLYVADTNNHQVKVLDLASETVSLVSFENSNKKVSKKRYKKHE